MFKNNIIKLKNKFIPCLLLYAASTGFCFADGEVGTSVIPLKTVLIKFAISMGSVILSLLIIWIGLNAYRQYSLSKFPKPNNKDLYGDSLETPKNMEDAVISFIDKNRL